MTSADGAPARLVDALARIDEREADIRAWAHVDRPGATASAAAMPPGTTLGALLLGVKDIVDVGGLPCRQGSPIHRDRVAVRDATLVGQLRRLGAVVVGKTATTEFAYLAPAPTRNPLDLARSPGGSSSGSAAAVADGHVDAALGTQTAASITRPASFCGVVGFKPTHGRFSLDGVRVVAPSLDTIGWIARNVATVRRLHDALCGPAVAAAAGRLGWCRTQAWTIAEPEMRDGFLDLVRRWELAEAASAPAWLDRAHATVMRHEMRLALAPERRDGRALLSPVLLELLDAPPIGDADYADARRQVAAFAIDRFFGDREVLLTPASSGEAVRFGSTGDPAFSRFVTLLGLPSVTIPFGRGRHGLPLGLQLIGRPDADATVLATAAALERRLAGRRSSAAAHPHAASSTSRVT